MTASYPELRALGEALGSLQAVLDGEIVALDQDGRPSFEALQPRMNTAEPSRVRRLAESVPVTYMIFDLMHLDGHSALAVPYRERRRLLEGLELAGPHWATAPSERGGGAAMLQAGARRRARGRRRQAARQPVPPGRARPELAKVKNFRTQSVLIGGLGRRPGEPRGRARCAPARDPGSRGPRPTSAGSAPASASRQRRRCAAACRDSTTRAPPSQAPSRALGGGRCALGGARDRG